MTVTLSAFLPEMTEEDPRLVVRRVLLEALEELHASGEPGELLASVAERWPAVMAAGLEEAVPRDPDGVRALRRQLGLDPGAWKVLVERAISLFEGVSDPASRLRIAAGLLDGRHAPLSAVVTGVTADPRGAGLLAAMHAVAPRGAVRRFLAGQLRRRGAAAVTMLNRDSPAWHLGFVEGEEISMVFREYPGIYSVFTLVAARGVRRLSIRPAVGERQLGGLLAVREGFDRRPLGLDACRAEVAAALARQDGGPVAGDWRALGHLVEERLFPMKDRDPGFVVGESGARILLDRIAQGLAEGDSEALREVARPGSVAEATFDLFGAGWLRHLAGLAWGASRVDASVEISGPNAGQAMLVGRLEDGQVLSRTVIRLVQFDSDWWVEDIQVAGVGMADMVYRPIWEGLFDEERVPLEGWDRLAEEEQELVAGLLDVGARLDEVAAAVAMLRNAALELEPATVAAACHLAWAAELRGGEPDERSLAERYGLEPATLRAAHATLVEGLDLRERDPRYARS